MSTVLEVLRAAADQMNLKRNTGASPRGGDMLGWAVVFLIVAIIAAIFGFFGIAAAAAGIAKIIFIIFIILFLISLVGGLMRRT